MTPIPQELKHDWRKQKPGQYFCDTCGEWTANLPLYLNELCPEKDRRKNKIDVPAIDRRGKR